MHASKRKPLWPLIICGGICSVVLGYFIGGAWSKGVTILPFCRSL